MIELFVPGISPCNVTLVLAPPMTLYIALSLTYTTYPSASDVSLYAQLIVTLVVDLPTTVTSEGDNDGAMSCKHLMSEKYQLYTYLLH